jgi:hypothetical protein
MRSSWRTRSGRTREILDRAVSLDPDLAAVLGAAAVAGFLALGGAWRRRREVERFCVACGRRLIAGIRTCDCKL